MGYTKIYLAYFYVLLLKNIFVVVIPLSRQEYFNKNQVGGGGAPSPSIYILKRKNNYQKQKRNIHLRVKFEVLKATEVILTFAKGLLTNGAQLCQGLDTMQKREREQVYKTF